MRVAGSSYEGLIAPPVANVILRAAAGIVLPSVNTGIELNRFLPAGRLLEFRLCRHAIWGGTVAYPVIVPLWIMP
jgi:hypothetical protein